MSSSEARYVAIITVNSKQAQQQLAELSARYAQMARDRKEAFKRGEIYAQEAEYKALGKQVKQLRQDVEQFSGTVNRLSAAKPNELRAAMASINRQLNSGDIERGSEEWEALQKTLGEVKAELKGIRDESKDAGAALDAAVSGLQGQLAGLGGIASSAVQEYAEMDTKMADVRKYTGLTQEQVEELNEEFKRMDTRTSREELNELAGAAGRLGITATDQILEFVDGANKINVALGDDLGKGAVDSIGKLAQMFGEADNLGLRGAMLATGSAVNELAQSSSAGAGYIVDFTADLSGVGKMAGFTQTQLMGLASALDQNMQEEKTSATVFSQLITKMYQDPAKFAQIAGQDVQAFTNLLKTDANAALMQFMQSMQQRGGFAELAPMFESMNLNGTRAVGVLSSVASHLDQVSEAQQIAAESYADGQSVLNEYNVQNSTVEAQMQKVQGAMKDLRVELGQRLWPAFESGFSVLSQAARIAATVVSWLLSTKAVLIPLAVAYAGLTAAVAAYNLKKKMAIALETAHTLYVGAHTVATRVATAAQLAFGKALVAVKAAMATNPVTALIVVLTSLAAVVAATVAAFRDSSKEMDSNAQALERQRRANEAVQQVRDKAAASVAAEKARIQQLTDIIHSNTYSVTQRRQAVEALQRIIPAYNAEISNEGRITRENTAAIDDYIKKLDQLAIAKAVAEKKEELARRKVERGMKMGRIDTSINAVNSYREKNASQMGKTTRYDALSRTYVEEWATEEGARTARELQTHQKRKAILEQEQATDDAMARALDNMIKTSSQIREAVVSQATASQPQASQPKTSQPKTSQPQTSRPQDLTSAYKAEDAAILEQQRQGTLTASETYDRRAQLLQRHYERLVELQSKYNTDTSKLQQDCQAAAYRLTEQYIKDDEAERKAAMDAALQADQFQANEETVAEAQKYLRGETTYEEYQKRLSRIAYEHARERAAIKEGQGFDATSENQQVQQYEIDQRKTAEEQAVADHEAAEQRKTEITKQQEQARTAAAKQAYQQLTQMASSYSSYLSAASSLEQAEVTKKYDAEIEKAGSSTKKGKKLEEKKQKELAAIKTKYNKKQMKMEIAQAIAQGAMAAINAYNCGVSVGGPWGVALGVAFAAMAAVQTGIQIATIKKQHQAEEAGYYEGGYTGGTNYRRRAGVVHEGEFVVNHEALANPTVAPLVRLLDEAQRSGTVSTLSADDVSALLPYSAAATVQLPTRAASPETPESGTPAAASPTAAAASASDTQQTLAASIDRLNERLAEGISAYAVMDGENGLYKKLKHYERLRS